MSLAAIVPCVQGTALLYSDEGPDAAGNFQEAFSCFGPRQFECPDNSKAPILVKRLVVGTGDHCSPPHCWEYVLPLLAVSQSGCCTIAQQLGPDPTQLALQLPMLLTIACNCLKPKPSGKPQPSGGQKSAMLQHAWNLICTMEKPILWAAL